MLVWKSYLDSKKVQKVLNKKPGEAGFSLIELVVVVAVLAVLAVIALPQFGNVAQNAARATAKSTLATLVKECAVDIAMGEDPVHAIVENGGGLVWEIDAAGDCTNGGTNVGSVCAQTGAEIYYGVNLMSGAKIPAGGPITIAPCAAGTYEGW